MPGLPHSSDDHAPRGCHAELAGGNELIVEAGFEGVHGARFNIENVGRQRKQLVLCQRVRQLRPSTDLESSYSNRGRY